jgi:hypothetical protein
MGGFGLDRAAWRLAVAYRGCVASEGLVLEPGFLQDEERVELLGWLGQIHPILELRYGKAALESGRAQRRLLRPVYWLGSWQFACLGYYRPPRGARGRCVAAEPYPPVLARLVARMEARLRPVFARIDLPGGFRLSTCLVNLYGRRLEPGRAVDAARLGEHRDFEPGPVASLSLGERALFEFVLPGRADRPSKVHERLWLDDGALLLFGGEHWKRRSLHRVLRVERRRGELFEIPVDRFETRRVNLTFRFVPDEHVIPFAGLPREAREDVRPYVQALAQRSPFWAAALRDAPPSPACDAG